MYLVGDFSMLRGSFSDLEAVKVQEEITKEDLVRSKQDSGVLIINLGNVSYFNPERDVWVLFPKK